MYSGGKPNSSTFGFSHEPVGIFRQEQPSRGEFLSSAPDGRNVRILVGVPFFNGWALVARIEPFLLGAGKWDETTRERAEPILEAVMAPQIPAGIGANRDFKMHAADTADVVAIFIDLVDEHAVSGIDYLRRLYGDDPLVSAALN